MSRILAPLFLLFLGFTSCMNETSATDVIFENNPLKNQHLIHSFSNQEHLIELFSRDTVLYEGYNELLFRIKDKNGKYISYAEIAWKTSTSNGIGSPETNIKKSTDTPELYASFLIFPPNTSDEIWTLSLNYSIQSTSYHVETPISIHQPNNNRISVKERTGADNKEYLFALSSPYLAINGFNNCELLVYEKLNQSLYKPSTDLKIQV